MWGSGRWNPGFPWGIGLAGGLLLAYLSCCGEASAGVEEGSGGPGSSAASSYSSGEQSEGSDRQEARGSPPTRTIRIRGSVGIHPLDRQAASQEAEQNAQNQLYHQLGQWAQQLSGQKLSFGRLIAEHGWLLHQPGVEQTQQIHLEEKPYGWVAWQEITFSVPASVLARWADRLQQQKRQRSLWVTTAVCATLCGWLIGLGGMVWWDRLTGGYYRTGVLLTSLMVLGVLTGLGWWFLLLWLD